MHPSKYSIGKIHCRAESIWRYMQLTMVSKKECSEANKWSLTIQFLDMTPDKADLLVKYFRVSFRKSKSYWTRDGSNNIEVTIEY